ncbi:hypothetical protein ABF173_002570 [Flavobacterium psychrophilum]
MTPIVLIIIGIIAFMICVWFLRWVLGIDQIIELQREQTKLLRNISENIQNKIHSDKVKTNLK